MHAATLKLQRGVTLIISLLFLLILTLLGIASVSTTALQERMAYNTREQNIALQAAEAALIDGENWLNGQRGIGTPLAASSCNGSCASVAVFRPGSPDTAANIIGRDYGWWQNHGREHGVDPGSGNDRADLDIVIGQPYYLIQELDPASMANSQPSSLGRGFDYGASRPHYYRIYGYGIGQSTYTRGSETSHFNVLLESLYAIPAF